MRTLTITWKTTVILKNVGGAVAFLDWFCSANNSIWEGPIRKMRQKWLVVSIVQSELCNRWEIRRWTGLTMLLHYQPTGGVLPPFHLYFIWAHLCIVPLLENNVMNSILYKKYFSRHVRLINISCWKGGSGLFFQTDVRCWTLRLGDRCGAGGDHQGGREYQSGHRLLSGADEQPLRQGDPTSLIRIIFIFFFFLRIKPIFWGQFCISLTSCPLEVLVAYF